MIKNPNWQDVVKKLLEKRTQKQLEKLTGVTQSTISDLKNGANKKRLSYASGIALLHALEQDKKTQPNDQHPQPPSLTHSLPSTQNKTPSDN